MKNYQDPLMKMDEEERLNYLSKLSLNSLSYISYDWKIWARPKQLPPDGVDWRVWLLMAGSGFGKTRSGSEYIRWIVETNRGKHLALIGDTMDDVRSVMIEGKSGILSVSPPWFKPKYYPSRRLLEWPNGAVAKCFAADSPEQLRGPEFDFGWADEIAKWRYPEAWDNLNLALRIGKTPQICVTTTPRPKPWLIELAKAHDTRLVTGHSKENNANLSAGFISAMIRKYDGTSLGQQELAGELITDPPNAIWLRKNLDSLIQDMPIITGFALPHPYLNSPCFMFRIPGLVLGGRVLNQLVLSLKYRMIVVIF
ncbi:terminase family protein [Alphaproteobacteria bacterium]|nr:terminase family protein [Alphaproteobacteria bacterium]